MPGSARLRCCMISGRPTAASAPGSTGVRLRSGHIDQVAWFFHNDNAGDLQARLFQVIPFETIAGWLPPESSGLFEAVFAHHGDPWGKGAADSRPYWRPTADGDPIGDLAAVTAALHARYPEAFQAGPPLPPQPAFTHAFAGLLMLADWLASDAALFPMLDGAERTPAETLHAARMAVATVGLDASTARSSLRPLPFHRTFGNPPRGLQAQVTMPTAQCVVLEAETGAGKTEAALWRFKSLFEQGAVDGLYFALPTRVAATAMFARVKTFRDAVFGAAPPSVVLAVPGQAAVDEAEGHPLPDFGFEWTDRPEAEVARRRWAAEHPKRFLAAPIAVGTIDQALLGAIRVKHSQMRGVALLRHLLVVDEVHASDPYMSVLLGALLRNHLRAGAMRCCCQPPWAPPHGPPSWATRAREPDAAEAVPYPALSWAEGGQQYHLSTTANTTSRKTVRIETVPSDGPARRHRDPRAHRGRCRAPRCSIIRNTVRAAVQTMQAIERAAPQHPALFRVGGIATVHHGRFAQPDRRLLDAAVAAALGRTRAGGGCIVVGTQTLEVSLDIDADLLITDLCPADVLLQRIGRLHRHPRSRPNGFADARTLVLVPRSRSLMPFATRQGGRHGLGLVYDDLRTIEATWRLIEADPAWIIPDANRRLVERSTHPAHLSRIEAELAADAAAWVAFLHARSGRGIAQVNDARSARLDWAAPFEELDVPKDERIATRLGAQDLQVDFPGEVHGPFGGRVLRLRIPRFMLGEAADGVPSDVVQDGEGITFTLAERRFRYDRWGLQPA